MKKILLIIFTVVSLSTKAQSVDEVINKFVEISKIGDQEKEPKSFKITRSYTSGAASDYTELIAVDMTQQKYYKKKSILDRDFYYVFNNETGFIKIPTASRDRANSFSIKDFNEKEKTDYKNEIKDGFYAFLNYKAKGFTAELSNENTDGKTCNKVTLERNGSKKAFYFDQNTGDLVKETWINASITHSFTYKNSSKTAEGFDLPKESTYMNTKDNKNIKVIWAYDFSEPFQGLILAR